MTDTNPFPGENNTGHIFDYDVRELTNPPPRWWMIAFWASLAFWIGYGLLYPMWPGTTGSNEGFLGWTQIKEYKKGLAEVEAVRAPYEEKLAAMGAGEILANPELSDYTVASAKVLFGDYCAPCHGGGGQGNPGYPVLADDSWLYGGTVEKIQESITVGRKGVMPANAKLLSSEEADTLAAYAVGLSEGKDDPAGKTLFLQKGCIACHGMDGKGMAALGSANLTDAIWRFQPAEGQSLADSVRQTILHGVNDPTNPKTRQAEMPAFGERLDETAVKKLAVYVHKLGGGE